MGALVTLDDMRQAARRRLPRVAFDFIDGGAETEHSVRRNRGGFEGLRLRPDVLVDVSVRSQRVTLFGRELATPVLLAPTGIARLAGHRGERAAAAGASAMGTVSVLSTASSVSYAEVAREAPEPQWFQLYPWGDRELTMRLIERARQAGFHAMVVTVDVPIMGGRDRDARNGMTSSFRTTPRIWLDAARHPRWLFEYLTHDRIYPAILADLEPGVRRRTPQLASRSHNLINPSHTWADVRWLRDSWDGPVLLKGILGADDAVRAVSSGVDGIVVSNHGGRQLDYAPATIEVLAEIVAAVGGRIEVLLDGGVRRGSDVVKALALGARAVLIGRPWLYGLAAAGSTGPAQVLRILRDEIDRTLALLGRPSIEDLDAGAVCPAGEGRD